MKKVIQFIKEDIKSDYEFVKSLKSDEVQAEKIELVKQMFKPSNIKKDVQQNWLWMIIIILALFVGMFVSAKWYQQQCNEFIYETYIEPELEKGFILDYNDTLVFQSHPSVSVSPAPNPKPYSQPN